MLVVSAFCSLLQQLFPCFKFCSHFQKSVQIQILFAFFKQCSCFNISFWILKMFLFPRKFPKIKNCSWSRKIFRNLKNVHFFIISLFLQKIYYFWRNVCILENYLGFAKKILFYRKIGIIRMIYRKIHRYIKSGSN